MTPATTRMGDLAALDAADPLAHHRERYIIPDGMIYLDGNSLGPASRRALASVDRAAREEWAGGLVGSWNEAGWFDLPVTLGERVAPLIGAGPGQVLVCDTISVNLFKLLHAALALRPGRRTIVAEKGSFPTDLYIAEGVAATAPGVTIRLEEEGGPDIDALIDADTAVVLVNHVDYRSGALRDMAALTARAHARGALVLWDLSHSAGALAVELDAAGADLAVGCTYKYLNGGPGAPAFLYAARRHHPAIRQPLTGWWGHARPFAFEPRHEAAVGIRAFLTGTQPILSFRALAGALEDWADVDLAQLRSKSLRLTGLFIALVEALCGGHGLVLATPREDRHRGSQVAFRHPHAYAIVQALIERGVIGDFRAPDLMRFGFAPLYLRHVDIAAAVEILRAILVEEAWRDPRFAERRAVT
jgi:kynureninase